MPTLENEALQGRPHGIRVAPGPTRVAFACALRDVLPAVATGLPGLGGSSALPSRPRVCRQDRHANRARRGLSANKYKRFRANAAWVMKCPSSTASRLAFAN